MGYLIRDSKQVLLAMATAILIVGITACGGSDGDGATPYQPSAPLAITLDNSSEVAATAVESDTLLEDVPKPIGFTNSTSGSNQSKTRIRDFVTNLIVNDVINSGSASIVNSLTSGPSLLANCNGPTGGTKNIPDSSDLTGTYTFNNCDEGNGLVLNGSFTVSGTITNNDPVFTVNFSMVYNNLTASSSGTPLFTVDGSMGMNMTIDINTFVSSGKLTIPKLTVVLPPNETVVLSGYEENFDFNGSLITYDIKYTVDSSSLGGSFTVNTTQTIAQLPNDEYPYEGQIVVTGANGSKVTVTALNNTTVRIDTDIDGDGNIDKTEDIPWSDFYNII